jgi:hypothetical protein
MNEKTLIVGDTHLQAQLMTPIIGQALAHTGAERLVMVGDYCDSFHADDEWFLEDLQHLFAWADELRSRGLTVELLYGNHDFYYLMEMGGPGTRFSIKDEVRNVLLGNLKSWIATVVDDILVTHAGVTGAWARAYLDLPDGFSADAVCTKLNILMRDGYFEELLTCGALRGGFDVPGPLWADVKELNADPLIGIRQIVGHTAVRECSHYERYEGNEIYEGAEFWNCDTFSHGDGSMLLVEKGDVSIVEIEDFASGLAWQGIPSMGGME